MRTRTRITLAGLALGAALAGGVAWATVPADNSFYTACKLKATGTIRLIDPSGPSISLLSHCTSYETQITWNQKGLKGDPGAAGTNGTNGVDGKAGATGPKGADGTNGVNGFTGPAGPKGDKGESGAPGADGQPGAPGQDGQPGGQGQQGLQGPAGPATDSVMGNVTVSDCPSGSGFGAGCSFYTAPQGASIAQPYASGSPGLPPQASTVAIASPGVPTTASALAVTLTPAPADGKWVSVAVIALATGLGTHCTVTGTATGATSVCAGSVALASGSPLALFVTTDEDMASFNVAFGWRLG
jgi:hypothetical protein